MFMTESEILNESASTSDRQEAMTDEEDEDKQSRERVALADEDIDDYDADYYREQLVRAAESVLSPVGWRESGLKRISGRFATGTSSHG